MDLGLAPHTIAIVIAVALAGIAALAVAIRQEESDSRALRLVSDEVGRLELAEIRQLLSQGLVTPNPQYWQVLEEGLVSFRPRDRQEELQRQRLLQDVRLRLLP
ncbi:hypothetical protein [Spirillospora sp. NPDC029432]|uniref:hypothetical protein n=1 Tax=Spirillospora sp. NPDC029432 TaxID=3154599 RepID=UPI003453348F